MYLPIATDSGFGQVTITRTGEIQYVSGGNGWFSLNGCYYRQSR
jgi:hypothetical protein